MIILYLLLIFIFLLPLNVVVLHGFGEFVYDQLSPLHKLPPKYDELVTGLLTLYVMGTMVMVDIAVALSILTILP